MRLNKRTRLVRGFGINDADYVTVEKRVETVNGKSKQVIVKSCAYYEKWVSMLSRCHSSTRGLYYASYADCTVCEEWKYFSNFKAWMEQQDWEGKHLDKDLLVPVNKIYSPETCCFIEPRINAFMNSGRSKGSGLPIGVSWNKRAHKFAAYCGTTELGQVNYMGLFETAAEAHKAWVSEKIRQAKILALECEERIGNALVDRYENFDKYFQNYY